VAGTQDLEELTVFILYPEYERFMFLRKTGVIYQASHFNQKATIPYLTDIKKGDRGSTVVKTLYYKSEGRWLDPSWCHWNFSLTYNPSDRTQPLTEMSTRSIFWG